MKSADTHRINSFIKYFLNYISYLEKEMANDSYNFNEIRIIFELLENDKLHAKDIETELDLDKGYTSRILKRLLDEKVIQREQSDNDKRLYYLSFTPEGRQLAQELYKKYELIISEDYDKLTEAETKRFVKALDVIETIHAKKFSWKDPEN